MNAKDFKKLQGWIDYDRAYLPSLNKEHRIQYFHKRIRLVLIKPLSEMYLSLMRGTPDSSMLLCFTTCICCSIEALGRFLNGNRRSSKCKFEKFVNDYMDPDFLNKTFGTNRYVDLLWGNFRNGLAHGFAIKHGGFEHNKKEYFFIKKINGVDVLEIDPTHFYKDFLSAIKKYTNQLRRSMKDDSLYIDFNKTFEDIFINGK